VVERSEHHRRIEVSRYSAASPGCTFVAVAYRRCALRSTAGEWLASLRLGGNSITPLLGIDLGQAFTIKRFLGIVLK